MVKWKGVDLSQGSSKRKRDVVRTLRRLRHLLVPAENAPSSSGWHNNVVLLLNLMMSFLCFAQFFLGLSQVTHWSLIFLCFFLIFYLGVKNVLDPYNHDSLLSSQSIKIRRSSLDLNSQPTTSQPYLLVTRVLESPQSFTSFLVIHFYFAYFVVWLFR
jgi:hypothetical protein